MRPEEAQEPLAAGLSGGAYAGLVGSSHSLATWRDNPQAEALPEAAEAADLCAVADGGGGGVSSYPCKGVDTVRELPCDMPDVLVGKVWVYPDGGVEALVAECGTGGAGRSGEPRMWVEGRPDVMGEYFVPAENWQGRGMGYIVDPRICPGHSACRRVINETRNARRAATKARRLARANNLRYMSTLSLPSGDRSRDAIVALWRRFIKSGRAARFFHAYHGGWLAFPELHPKTPGTYHLHVLHSNRIDAVRVRAAWTRFLVRCGYVLPDGANEVRCHEKYWGSARKAAEYAAKYLRKGFFGDRADHAGKHRYLVSQGLSDGVQLHVVESVPAFLDAVVPGCRLVRYSDALSPVWWLWACLDPP